MTIRIQNTLNGLASLGSTAKDQERDAKRKQIEEIAQLSALADSKIIERAEALAGLLALGHASCSDLNEYNETALNVWRQNIKVFQMMITAGADRSKLQFPFQPPLFTVPGGVNVKIECTQAGKNCGVSVDSPCSGGSIDPRMRIDVEGTPAQVDLFAPLQPTGKGLEGLGALALGPLVIAGIWAVGFLFASAAVTWLVVEVLDALPSSRLSDATKSYNNVIKQIGAEKATARIACAQTGASESECRRIVEESFGTPKEPGGLLDGVFGTAVKLGALYLGGTFIYRKMQEK